MKKSIRTSGLIKVVLTVPPIFAIWLFYDHLFRQGQDLTKLLFVPMVILAAFTLVGLTEVITGTPFLRLSDSWDSLTGWQRGILGLLVVIAAFGLVFLGAFLILGGPL